MALNFQKLIDQIQAAQKKANKANEERYQQILGLLSGLGTAGRERISRQTAQQQAQATQSLITRGLGSTTITEAARRGIASDAELARQQLEESIAIQKAGVMERRQDIGPDWAMYANLLQAAAAGGDSDKRQVISGGLGPMASRGLDIFGQPLGKYGGGGALGSGGGGLSTGGRGGGATIRGAAARYTAPRGLPAGGGRGFQVPPSFGPTIGFYGAGEQPGMVSGIPGERGLEYVEPNATEMTEEPETVQTPKTYEEYKKQQIAQGKSYVSPMYWHSMHRG